MKYINSVILEGIIEGFELVDGVLDFEVSVERNKMTTSFDCICYGDMAEVCNKRFKVGRAVRVVGRLHKTEWKRNGEKLSAVEVLCEHIEIL